MNKSCVFCNEDKIQSKIINLTYKGRGFMCFEPLHPHVAGHLLVVPKKPRKRCKRRPGIDGANFRTGYYYCNGPL